MINFASHFPDLFTLSYSPKSAVVATEANENEDQAEQTGAQDEVDSAKTTTVTKSAGGNLNKTQKKKKKRAALEANASKALGDGFEITNENLVDPTSWPTLCVIANCQVRLFISRCDPFLEVAIDSDRLWTNVGLADACESSELIDTTSPSEENEDGGGIGEENGDSQNDKRKVKRVSLLHHPKNSDTLPPVALSTRLLLECLQKAPDVQQAAANALQRSLNGKPQEAITHVLDYWLKIYTSLIEVRAPDFNSFLHS